MLQQEISGTSSSNLTKAGIAGDRCVKDDIILGAGSGRTHSDAATGDLRDATLPGKNGTKWQDLTRCVMSAIEEAKRSGDTQACALVLHENYYTCQGARELERKVLGFLGIKIVPRAAELNPLYQELFKVLQQQGYKPEIRRTYFSWTAPSPAIWIFNLSPEAILEPGTTKEATPNSRSL